MWYAALTRILLWGLSGLLAGMSAPEEVKSQIETIVNDNPFVAFVLVVVLTGVWYWKDKLSKGQT